MTYFVEAEQEFWTNSCSGWISNDIQIIFFLLPGNKRPNLFDWREAGLCPQVHVENKVAMLWYLFNVSHCRNLRGYLSISLKLALMVRFSDHFFRRYYVQCTVQCNYLSTLKSKCVLFPLRVQVIRSLLSSSESRTASLSIGSGNRARDT